jgi:hypothetical protein
VPRWLIPDGTADETTKGCRPTIGTGHVDTSGERPEEIVEPWPWALPSTARVTKRFNSASSINVEGDLLASSAGQCAVLRIEALPPPAGFNFHRV